MKNFRKTIIALATVAAMLVPSVAMAATITAEVAPEVAGNVYAGIYNGGVLQKAVLGGVTEAQAGAGSTEDEELTQPVVSAKVVTADDAKGIKKLVFTATPDADMGEIATAAAIFSYDSTVVVPEDEAFTFFTDPYSGNTIDTNSSVKTYTDGNRVIVKAEGVTAGGAEFVIPEDGINFIEFYFTVAEGATITADTFKIEDDYDANPVLSQVYGDRTSSTAAGLFIGTSSEYVRYGAWNNGADTLTWKGFTVVEDVEPTDKPVVTVTDEFVGVKAGVGSVHKLVFSVKAPAGTAEATASSITLSIDMDDVTLVNAGTGAALTTIKAGASANALKAAARNATAVMGGWTCPDCGYVLPLAKTTSNTASFDSTTNVFTANVTTEITDFNNDANFCWCVDEPGGMDLTNRVAFAELYYTVKDGAKVSDTTFTAGSAAFGDITDVTFAGFPWKAATGGNKTLTIENVNLTGITYDEVKVFVWDDKQIAQCAPATGTVK